MIHIVVNSMVHRVGNIYPSTKTKSNLAKAIITAFPKLHSGGKLGYENYYSPYTEYAVGNKKRKVTPHGHIEERLKTMQKHVGVHVQARRKRVIVLAEEFHSSAPFSKEDLSMIGELRFDDLGYERKLDYMEKTSCSRRKWIVNCRPTFEDLLKTFPPLKDLAIHFQKDFCCNFPESDDFLAHWEQITPHVISWARQKTNLMVKQILAELDMQDNPSIGIEMDFAFLLLPFIIKVPSKNKSCASAAEVAEHFIQFYPVSTPMEVVIQSRTHKHPLVIALGTHCSVEQLFIVTECRAVPVNRCISYAVDILIKLYFLMNMEYAEQCSHILYFLQHTVLGYQDEMHLSRGASDLSLYLRQKLNQF
ncbi:uncharacterized protein LOC136089202 [Hydra vulgaris]|uniref:Uncharacterized protein LOC136089202 n=1 Tax=Hydra vulgaris TaxID=6087 RepID=A0ABM4D9L6_HYDVU